MYEGQRGLCFIQSSQENKVVLTKWGRSRGFIVDPIEKTVESLRLLGVEII